MATARPEFLVGGAAILLLLYIPAGIPSTTTFLFMIRRLRWLFLAILLVYGWWTPGESLWSYANALLSPTFEGLYLGLLRIVALIEIVAAVHLLLQSTSREELLPAIMQLVRPLTTQRLRQRIAVRALLAIEAVPRVQSLASDISRQVPVGTRKFTAIASASRLLYKNVLDSAAHAGAPLIEVKELATPPWWQWIIPLLMSGVVIIIV